MSSNLSGGLVARSKVRQLASRFVAERPKDRYNITASSEKRFLWYRVAKVGTRTIYNRLLENEVELSIKQSFAYEFDPEEFRDYFKFAFVRNPWDRLVSCWLNKVVEFNRMKFSPEDHARMQDFAQFVDWVEREGIHGTNIHIRSQSSLIDLNHCDFFGRMENFEEDLQRVFARVDVHTKNRSVRNRSSNRKPYTDYYTSDLVDRVAELYSKDVQLFGYRFDG